MFGRKSNNVPTKTSADKSKRSLSQYGLLDIDNMTNIEGYGNIDDDDDDDLEAELLALTRGNAPKPKPKAKPVVDPAELDKMIQESLRDIPSDEDVSSGEDDPSIMAELQELQSDDENEPAHPAPVQAVSPPPSSSKSVLEERLKLYQTAEQNAKNAGDTTKARRMTRGIATLKDLLKKANAGGEINVDDIPPVVSTGAAKPPPAPVETPEKAPERIEPTPPSIPSVPPPIPPRASLPSSSIQDFNNRQISPEPSPAVNNVLEILKERELQYKKGAVAAKKSGDIQTALAYMKIVKSLEPIIKEVEGGAAVDLASLPPPLSDPSLNVVSQSPISPSSLKRQESEKQTSTLVIDVSEKKQKTIDTPQPEVSTSSGVPQPTSVLEALEQRLQLFKDREEAAKKENDGGKARRNARIVKQYQDAIKLHKAGKPVPIDELPTPPGWPPIPAGDSKPTTAPVETPKPHTAPVQEPEKTPVKSPNVATKGHSAAHVSRNERQLQQILERQKAFKTAALKAKQDGDMEKAKEYLRVVMGIEPMIEASKSGIPIDLNSLPLLPNEKAILEEPKGEVIQFSNCIQGSDLDVYHKLETDLTHQIELCSTTRDHFKAIGDIVNANRFEQLALQCKKDLKFVRLANSSNLRVPKFHYETKSFSIVQCNTDLTDNDVEVSVVQGVNYNVPNPKEVDTYVKLHFPYPTETPQQYKSVVVYNTNNPAYNFVTTFNMERNARACQRIFKRQVLKCEVWSKGGFFRGDTLIGTASVKLAPLETQCTVHDAFDLMDGRKTVGKIELKIKIRDPILRKQVEHVEEKWLVIDS